MSVRTAAICLGKQLPMLFGGLNESTLRRWVHEYKSKEQGRADREAKQKAKGKAKLTSAPPLPPCPAVAAGITCPFCESSKSSAAGSAGSGSATGSGSDCCCSCMRPGSLGSSGTESTVVDLSVDLSASGNACIEPSGPSEAGKRAKHAPVSVTCADDAGRMRGRPPLVPDWLYDKICEEVLALVLRDTGIPISSTSLRPYIKDIIIAADQSHILEEFGGEFRMGTTWLSVLCAKLRLSYRRATGAAQKVRNILLLLLFLFSLLCSICMCIFVFYYIFCISVYIIYLYFANFLFFANFRCLCRYQRTGCCKGNSSSTGWHI